MFTEPQGFSAPETAAGGSRRYAGLDVLRGLAAAAVMFHHCFQLYPQMYPYRPPEQMHWLTALLTYSPLHLFWAGDEAVILFFVLSGFVLALPYTSGRRFDYAAFIAKRILRIYLPYLVSLAAAVVMMLAFSNHPVEGVSRLYLSPWKAFAAEEILRHALLVGGFKISLFNPVVWSLRIEMQASLIFPVILWMSMRFRPVLLFPLMGFFSFLGFAWFLTWHPVWGNAQILFYLPCFMAGAWLACHREGLAKRYEGLKPFTRKIIAAAAAACLCVRWYYWPEQDPRPVQAAELLVIIAAVCVIIIAVMVSRSRWLTWNPLVRLGHISYSLYLYHVIVILSLLYALHEKVPLWAIALMAIVISPCIAGLSYDLVEVPAMKFGRKAAERIRAMQEAGGKGRR